jgi:hypothetical protein
MREFLKVWCRIGFVGGLGQIQLKEQSMTEWGFGLGESLRLGVWTVYIIIITALCSFQAQNTKTIGNSTGKRIKLGWEDSIE